MQKSSSPPLADFSQDQNRWDQTREKKVRSNKNKKSRTYGTSDRFAKINLICQICQRVRSVRESDLWGRVGGRGSPKWEAVRGRESPKCEADRTLPASRTSRSREINQTGPRIVLPHPVE